MATLSAKDYALLRLMHDLQLLTDVDGTRMNMSNGAITLDCADCDQAGDWNNFLAELCLQHRSSPRVHSFRLNGGGILMSAPELLKEFDYDKMFLAQIRGAIELKAIKTIIISGHIPCGMAGLANITLPQLIHYLVLAKAIISREIPVAEISCMVHVDYGPELSPGRLHQGKKTYHLATKRYEDWLVLFNEVWPEQALAI